MIKLTSCYLLRCEVRGGCDPVLEIIWVRHGYHSLILHMLICTKLSLLAIALASCIPNSVKYTGSHVMLYTVFVRGYMQFDTLLPLFLGNANIFR